MTEELYKPEIEVGSTVVRESSRTVSGFRYPSEEDLMRVVWRNNDFAACEYIDTNLDPDIWAIEQLSVLRFEVGSKYKEKGSKPRAFEKGIRIFEVVGFYQNYAVVVWDVSAISTPQAGLIEKSSINRYEKAD